MTETTPVEGLRPMERAEGCPFDPPERLAALRDEQPLVPMAYPDDHIGWLATSHEMVRAVLADDRLSHRAELNHSPVAMTTVTDKPQPAPPGSFTVMDPPEHTRYRQLLTGQFTVRRMRQLTDRVHELVTEHLDAMEKHGPPVDLCEALTVPIPGLIICELLGVAAGERVGFQRDLTVLMTLNASREDKIAASARLGQFLRDLVLAKRAEPADDLLSGLVANDDLTEEELINISGIVLGAGFDTTANMLAMSAYALMSNPDQVDILLSEPENTDKAVEELLRYLSVTGGTMRTALEDIELGGQPIKAGQTITVSLPTANRDPKRFPDNPDSLDLHRSATGHLAFGHGIHQCLGQQLARVEIRVTIPELFRRFPTLRLAVTPEEVPMRTDMMIYGAHRLPVTWDTV
ncbi:cytochrome P450 [Nonomuraea sp. NPDC000554]|uniref:cytochrome P450 n=1 Tax=Nonomuraea sp. NPDC000554 TaxID=3154259 RepID=UPI00332A964A